MRRAGCSKPCSGFDVQGRSGLEPSYLLLVVRVRGLEAFARAVAVEQRDGHAAARSERAQARDRDADRKSTRLNSSHTTVSRMPSSA